MIPLLRDQSTSEAKYCCPSCKNYNQRQPELRGQKASMPSFSRYDSLFEFTLEPTEYLQNVAIEKADSIFSIIQQFRNTKVKKQKKLGGRLIKLSVGCAMAYSVANIARAVAVGFSPFTMLGDAAAGVFDVMGSIAKGKSKDEIKNTMILHTAIFCSSISYLSGLLLASCTLPSLILFWPLSHQFGRTAQAITDKFVVSTAEKVASIMKGTKKDGSKPVDPEDDTRLVDSKDETRSVDLKDDPSPVDPEKT